jgi:hypothetical protein
MQRFTDKNLVNFSIRSFSREFPHKQLVPHDMLKSCTGSSLNYNELICVTKTDFFCSAELFVCFTVMRRYSGKSIVMIALRLITMPACGMSQGQIRYRY